jgi:hypothetical protein
MTFALIVTGAFLLGNALAWRLRAERVTGTVIGVRPRGQGIYCAVYRYTDSVGRTVDASCNFLSASLADKQTGSTRQLLVIADQPQLVREANSVLLESGGVGLLVFGFLIAWPEGPAVVGLELALSALLGWYAFKRRTGSAARDSASPASPVAREAAPLQRAEDILATSEAAQREVRNQRRMGPVSILIGLAMLAVAVFAGRSLAQLEIAGLHAPGKVLQLVSRSASRGGSTYHPVVRFTTAGGTPVQFEDGVGTNPPQYSVGNDVQVLYLADAAPSSAMIDRGIGNWALSVGFGLAGVALIALGVRQTSSVRSMNPSQPPLPIPAPPASTFGTLDAHTPINVASKPDPMDGVTIKPLDPRPARRARWLGWCFLIGWSLWIASAFTPSAKSAKGFGPVLLLIAPGLGAILLFCAQTLLVVVIIIRALIGATEKARASGSPAVRGREPAGALARILDGMLTFILVMMAGACALIAAGLAAQLL